MSKSNDLPSFPPKPIKNVDSCELNEVDSEVKAALNESFLEKLDESTKFSYAGECAETLYILYGLKNKYVFADYCTNHKYQIMFLRRMSPTSGSFADGTGTTTIISPVVLYMNWKQAWVLARSSNIRVRALGVWFRLEGFILLTQVTLFTCLHGITCA